MRVVSLVPSWTATLIKAGLAPVGRTRFCVEPKGAVESIPVVGGTKQVDWARIKELKPDVILMDKEENTISLADACPFPLITTHVTDWPSMIEGLRLLQNKLESNQLVSWIERAEKIKNCPRGQWNPEAPAGFLDWIQRPAEIPRLVSYVIWKNPWMVIQRETFIADVLHRLGAELLVVSPKKYPTVELESLKDSLLLFSTEPYPFAHQIDELRELNIEGTLVDGQAFSWFGCRAIEFLEHELLQSP